jgi:purine-binding chemotaxis protein CheW
MTDRVDQLRAQFDRGFAAPPSEPEPPQTVLLRVRIGGAPHAIALAEIASLHADLAITPLPGPVPALLGVASIRGVSALIYDLRVALRLDAVAHPRWTVLVRGTTAGFAFDGFEGYARVARAGDVVVLGTVLAGISSSKET